MKSKQDPSELLALRLARIGKEASRALPMRMYRDPANYIEFGCQNNDGGGVVVEMELDEIDAALEQWAQWMTQPGQLVAGYPSRAAGIAAPSWIKDSEELYEAADCYKVEATDAAIDSLRALSRLAITIRWGLGPKVWRFADHGTAYKQAKEELAPLLRRRSVI